MSTTTTKKNKIITIEGNIGTGKSTLLSHLRDRYGDQVVFLDEPVSIWDGIRDEEGVPILIRYYQNTKQYAFTFQMMAFISRVKLLREAIKNNPGKTIIAERSLHADNFVFALLLKRGEYISAIDYQIYKMLYDEFISDYPVEEIIYIKTDPEICSQRIKKRSRKGEEQIELSYLQDCHKYHEDWLSTGTGEKDKTTTTQITCINGNVDIEEHPEVLESWIELVGNKMLS